MPLTQISLQKGKSLQYHKAIMDSIYNAMRETFDVPANDRFMMITEHSKTAFDYGAHYLEIERSDDLVIIQLTVNDTRSIEQKKSLFGLIAKNLQSAPGIRPEDVFINLVEVAKENWSFGNGLAQYA